MSVRKQKLTKKQRRQSRQFHTGVLVLSAFCVAAIGLMAFWNRLPAARRYTYTTEGDIWYALGGGVEIASPGGEEMPVAPELATDSPEPTQEPTPVPTATPTVEPEPTPTLEPELPENSDVTITITAVGDCTLGSYPRGNGVYGNFMKAAKYMGYDYFLANVRELFEQDDLTIINLEGTLTDSTDRRPGRTFNFSGPPEYVNILTGSSVEICNVANNHSLDYQWQGLKDTYDTLTEAGIGASGFGLEYYTEVNGYTVGSLGFTEWDFEVEDILRTTYEAAQKCDLLIVSMHWGREWHPEFSDYTGKMGRALVEAGADLVIGNHPHIYGAIMKYKGKYIINTLGNFCFGGNDNPEHKECAIFRQQFIMRPDGEVEDGGIDIIPAWISGHMDYNDFQPVIAEPSDGARMLYEIAKYSNTLNMAEDVIWMDDSYVYRIGMLEKPGQASTPEPEGDIEA